MMRGITLKELTSRPFLKDIYRELRLTEDEFNELVTKLRKAVIASKRLKMPQLKDLVMRFSELRSILVVNDNDDI